MQYIYIYISRVLGLYLLSLSLCLSLKCLYKAIKLGGISIVQVWSYMHIQSHSETCVSIDLGETICELVSKCSNGIYEYEITHIFTIKHNITKLFRHTDQMEIYIYIHIFIYMCVLLVGRIAKVVQCRSIKCGNWTKFLYRFIY